MIDAENPCRWLRPATGPISPEAKKPATAEVARLLRTASTSCPALLNNRLPRLLHETSNAPSTRVETALGTERLEQLVEVVRGGLCVTDLEPHRTSHGHQIAYQYGLPLAVDP